MPELDSFEFCLKCVGHVSVCECGEEAEVMEFKPVITADFGVNNEPNR